MPLILTFWNTCFKIPTITRPCLTIHVPVRAKKVSNPHHHEPICTSSKIDREAKIFCTEIFWIAAEIFVNSFGDQSPSLSHALSAPASNPKQRHWRLIGDGHAFVKCDRQLRMKLKQKLEQWLSLLRQGKRKKDWGFVMALASVRRSPPRYWRLKLGKC